MIPYGHAYDVQTEWCIDDAGSRESMLCGRRKGTIAAVPPLFPRFVHQVCHDLWFRTDRVTREKSWAIKGTCPFCLGRVALDGQGRIRQHRQWSWSEGKLALTTDLCSGEGERPEVES
jgi:hypothetical protein